MTSWDSIRRAASIPEQALRAAFADPLRAQTTLLLDILARNAETRFGRERRFGEVATIEDFRRRTAIGGYDAFRAPIAAMASGVENVLTRDSPVAFEETGGTATGRKLVPYTRESLAGFRAAVLPWLADLARRRPGVADGRTYLTISPVVRAPRRTPGGTPIGLESEVAYLGDDLAAALSSLLAAPLELASIPDFAAWRLATLAHLVECEDLAFVSVWSPTFLLALIRALPSCFDAIARRTSPAARARLARALGERSFDAARLWPRLDTISCWADGSSASLARQLAALCPQARIEPKGLLATEAAITIPWNGGIGCAPALTSAFIEFVGDGGDLRLAHELDDGARYDVVITTWGGLYRYAIGDRVLCVGHDGAVPRLVFQGRSGLVSDMVGEKLDEAFVAGALALLPVAAALVPRPSPRPHYELWLDAEVDSSAAAIGIVERGLGENPQYAYARAIGQLGPCVPRARPGFVAAREAGRAASGSRLGDLKHAALIFDEPAAPGE